MGLTATLKCMTAISEFWNHARTEIAGLPEELPEAWPFGATPAHADELLALVLAGTKTGTASSLWDYEATGDPLPQPGEFSIILDGAGAPRAIIKTTHLEIVPFDQVTAEHALAEGEGNRTLAYWRTSHERYWRAHSENARGFDPTMLIVCERFELVFTDGSHDVRVKS